MSTTVVKDSDFIRLLVALGSTIRVFVQKERLPGGEAVGCVGAVNDVFVRNEPTG
jgi:hypothetical protein